MRVFAGTWIKWSRDWKCISSVCVLRALYALCMASPAPELTVIRLPRDERMCSAGSRSPSFESRVSPSARRYMSLFPKREAKIGTKRKYAEPECQGMSLIRHFYFLPTGCLLPLILKRTPPPVRREAELIARTDVFSESSAKKVQSEKHESTEMPNQRETSDVPHACLCC